MPARCDSVKIRAKMNDKRMTAAQLADASGLSTSTLNRVLNEKDYRTSDSTVNLLATALDCSPFALLRDDVIGTMIQQETEQAVSGVVAEAVAEALTVVVDDQSPQEIAKAVPAMEVKAPHVLDVSSYVEYIKEACKKEIDAFRLLFEEMRKSRNFWRIFAFMMVAVSVGLSAYFVWEILNPDKGVTAVLWEIYNSRMIPGVTPRP